MNSSESSAQTSKDLDSTALHSSVTCKWCSFSILTGNSMKLTLKCFHLSTTTTGEGTQKGFNQWSVSFPLLNINQSNHRGSKTKMSMSTSELLLSQCKTQQIKGLMRKPSALFASNSLKTIRWLNFSHASTDSMITVSMTGCFESLFALFANLISNQVLNLTMKS